jgi:uncharacterized repeat protein (TIGR03837 family)
MNSAAQHVHIFCKVVDNYGDIGVCWRLARQLATEHAQIVTLWVDDLVSFKTICAAVETDCAMQVVQGVHVIHWTMAPLMQPDHIAVGDIVIEGFGCALPDAYIQAMAKKAIPPVWLNLEYLSAEDWVEDCHAMVSVHPSLGLKKYFFFPGFSDKTGGLLIDRATQVRKAEFDRNPHAREEFFRQQGIPVIQRARYVSLFCYPSAPVHQLLMACADAETPIVCVVPEGVARDAVTAFVGHALVAGESVTIGQLTLHCLPFIDQPAYDTLLWACDMNYVRGEDSFVRAQWAAKPFVWHIYIQDEDAHLIKLNAFLARYTQHMPVHLKTYVTRLWQAWNGVKTPETRDLYRQVWLHEWDAWELAARDWHEFILKNGDLATNIRRFASKIS